MFENFFKKSQNVLEDAAVPVNEIPHAPDEMFVSCPSCKKLILREELVEKSMVCPSCSYYFRVSARQRIAMVTDSGSFEERDKDMVPGNPLSFPGYPEKLKKARISSGENESVVCGTAKIGGYACGIFAMDGNFIMGSMGSVTGEKITRLFEYATKHSLPVIGFCVSGGARMQEGMLSLMQMAKTSAAVKKHSDRHNLYISVLTDPTTGGVTASFGMEGDIILTEPGALIGFAGPRVIEQTINRTLPEGFQRAEFQLEKGFVDAIVERGKMRSYLKKLLMIHQSV